MFNHCQALPADPILGLIQRYRDDQRSEKIDLGIGVYKDAQGSVNVLSSVKKAEQRLVQTEASKAYVGPFGDDSFSLQLAGLVLGQEAAPMKDKRVALMQTTGGCGALRIAAELVKRTSATSRVWVGNPTWANHAPILEEAGLELKIYPYYDYNNHRIRFEDMMSALQDAQSGDVLLLHACCHNPCGADLSRDQWQEIATFCFNRNLLPLIDAAYLGFSDGLEQDAYGIRLITESLPESIFVISCSKNFGLYRERTGLLGVVTESTKICKNLRSHLGTITRGIYSMPPSHGALVVDCILRDRHLKEMWEQELNDMRKRVNHIRSEFSKKMDGRTGTDFNFIEAQRGMFSFLGISEEQVEQLARNFGIYMVNSSRVNVSGLNEHNLSYFCEALEKVL